MLGADDELMSYANGQYVVKIMNDYLEVRFGQQSANSVNNQEC
jgi:hypothetical protein